MKAVRCALIWALLGVCPLWAGEEGDPFEALVRKSKKAVAGVSAYAQDGSPLCRASGFFVGKDSLVTSRSAVAGAAVVKVTLGDGNVLVATNVLAEDGEGDLIVLEVTPEEGTTGTLEVAEGAVEEGEIVVVVGHRGGVLSEITKGRVEAIHNIPYYGDIYYVKAPSVPGVQGGPVLNLRGEVVAVATARSVDSNRLICVIPAERLRQLGSRAVVPLERWNEKERFSRGRECFLKGIQEVWAYDFALAASYFEEASRLEPENARNLFYLGLCQLKAEKFAEAAATLEKVTGIAPAFAPGHYYLGVARWKAGAKEEAVDAYRAHLRLSPDNAQGYSDLGYAYCELELFHEAITALKEAVKVDPQNAQAYYNLGYAYGKCGESYNRLSSYKRAVQLKDGFIEAQVAVGTTYLEMHENTNALVAFKDAVLMNTRYSAAHFGLGVAYLRLGERGHTFTQYQILKEMDPDLAKELFEMLFPEGTLPGIKTR